MPKNLIKAVYHESEVPNYRGNPFIEALPPIISRKEIIKSLQGNIECDPKDIFKGGHIRVHIIASIIDSFFQPLSSHLQLEEKVSIMIRQGYVGRNIEDGSLNRHKQNCYQRVLEGDLNAFRFEDTASTALSLSFIGCSGAGKTTTLNRIFSLYPQVLFHEKHNLTQISYLKVDCPYDGELRSLCIQFFRALDRVTGKDYEKKYTRKGIGEATLLAKMCQVANEYAIGVLIIDEIQHLNVQRSGGIETMLNFFVTLVNVIGLPVILVGTPKAKPIFETDLRAARRGAGFGSLLWDPIKEEKPKVDIKTGKIKKTEWIGFTDKLWKLQWLQKRDESLSDDLRACWYDLSQGVLDIVIKLFVLAQLRAIATGVERLTPKLLQQVYNDELKPVHNMLQALRSGDPEEIVKYSDLTIPDIDKNILNLQSIIKEKMVDQDSDLDILAGNDQAKRLYNLLVGMDCQSKLVLPLVKRVFQEHPGLTMKEMIPIVLEWYEGEKIEGKKPTKEKMKVSKNIKEKDWHTLDSEDLRFMFSQSDKGKVYEDYKQHDLIFDIGKLVGSTH